MQTLSHQSVPRDVHVELLRRLAPPKREAGRQQLAQLAGVRTAALGVGVTAPRFELHNIHGYRVTLAERLRAGPVVVSFFRGTWCSLCNLELRALQRRLHQIEALGRCPARHLRGASRVFPQGGQASSSRLRHTR